MEIFTIRKQKIMYLARYQKKKIYWEFQKNTEFMIVNNYAIFGKPFYQNREIA